MRGMKWSAVVAAGLGIAAVGAIVFAVALMVGEPVFGVVILALGSAVALMGGTMYFAEKR
ncbi:hypothetical protein D514_0102105 [Microbacterium sp. UCD-TDU]|nr:hypothetical protein D514_0102105 [Microbacterium sp. UCD-TDU]